MAVRLRPYSHSENGVWRRIHTQQKKDPCTTSTHATVGHLHGATALSRPADSESTSKPDSQPDCCCSCSCAAQAPWRANRYRDRGRKKHNKKTHTHTYIHTHPVALAFSSPQALVGRSHHLHPPGWMAAQRRCGLHNCRISHQTTTTTTQHCETSRKTGGLVVFLCQAIRTRQTPELGTGGKAG